jgi:hypothetical protein
MSQPLTQGVSQREEPPMASHRSAHAAHSLIAAREACEETRRIVAASRVQIERTRKVIADTERLLSRSLPAIPRAAAAAKVFAAEHLAGDSNDSD